MVMEYLGGEALPQRLEKGATPLDQALQIAVEITDALDKAHRQGGVDRDRPRRARGGLRRHGLRRGRGVRRRPPERRLPCHAARSTVHVLQRNGRSNTKRASEGAEAR